MIRRTLQFGGIGVTSYDIPADSNSEFNVVTLDGWTIKYDNNIDIVSMSNALLDFLKEKITAEERAELEYVDLTIQDRITYK